MNHEKNPNHIPGEKPEESGAQVEISEKLAKVEADRVEYLRGKLNEILEVKRALEARAAEAKALEEDVLARLKEAQEKLAETDDNLLLLDYFREEGVDSDLLMHPKLRGYLLDYIKSHPEGYVPAGLDSLRESGFFDKRSLKEKIEKRPTLGYTEMSYGVGNIAMGGGGVLYVTMPDPRGSVENIAVEAGSSKIKVYRFAADEKILGEGGFRGLDGSNPYRRALTDYEASCTTFYSADNGGVFYEKEMYGDGPDFDNPIVVEEGYYDKDGNPVAKREKVQEGINVEEPDEEHSEGPGWLQSN